MDLVNNKEELEEYIIKFGINYQDQLGNTILHRFSKEGNLHLIGILFKRTRTDKCNPNLKNNEGRTALFYSLNEDIAEFLLFAKTDYKIKDNDGKTAIDYNFYVDKYINNNCSSVKKKILGYIF